jgi:hypothetical protein
VWHALKNGVANVIGRRPRPCCRLGVPPGRLFSRELSTVSYLATRIPTQWSPLADCALSEGLLLRPAGRIVVETKISRSWHNSIFFISESRTPQQHQELLKEWVLFHAFFLGGGPAIVSDYEMGKLTEHTAFERLEAIPFDTESSDYARDYSDIAKSVYWFHEADLRIDYRTSFDTYRRSPSELRDLVALWLFPFQRGIENGFYRLIDPAYLNVMTKATIIESIIGHPENCPTKPECPDCGKKLTHRASSEREWRHAFLAALPLTPEACAQYAALLIRRSIQFGIGRPTQPHSRPPGSPFPSASETSTTMRGRLTNTAKTAMPSLD